VFLWDTIVVASFLRCITLIYPPARLSNDKPSAIFRLRGTFTPGANVGPSAFSGGGINPTVGGDVTAILGIAIEPLSQISLPLADQVNAHGSGAVVVATRTADPGYLAEQVVKHLFNFVSSFVGTGTVDENTLVPMGVMVRWYEGFRTKLKNMGPGFLDRTTD
jgi:protein Hikeshi